MNVFYSFPMMKKREAWLIGHGWNKFKDNDTFLIDLFSVGSTTGVGEITYGTKEYVVAELKDLDNFKHSLSLFSSKRAEKLQKKVELAKIAQESKNKKSDKNQVPKPVDDLNTVTNLAQFKFDEEEYYQKFAISAPANVNQNGECRSVAKKAKESKLRDMLQDWDDRKNGVKKSKTVPLVMRSFALEFKVESLNSFKMKVKFFNPP